MIIINAVILLLYSKVEMFALTENTDVHYAQLTTYRDKHKYKHRFSIAQSNMKVEQDMRLRNKLQNYWRKIN